MRTRFFLLRGKTDWQVFLLDNLMAVSDYHIAAAVVLSNDREIETKGNVLYLPIYHLMFLGNKIPEREEQISSFGYCIF